MRYRSNGNTVDIKSKKWLSSSGLVVLMDYRAQSTYNLRASKVTSTTPYLLPPFYQVYLASKKISER